MIKINGKCHYKGLIQDLGYIKTNRILVCLEFNGVCHAKIIEMVEILNKNTLNNYIDFTKKRKNI